MPAFLWSSRLPAAFEAGVEFIFNALRGGGTVLVHCHRGISRSCTLVMAFLVWSQRRTADEAFQMVRAKRRQCDPNLSYICALSDWANKCRAAEAEEAETVGTEPPPHAEIPTMTRARTGPLLLQPLPRPADGTWPTAADESPHRSPRPPSRSGLTLGGRGCSPGNAARRRAQHIGAPQSQRPAEVSRTQSF